MSNRPTPMTFEQFEEVFAYLRDNVSGFEKGSDEEIAKRNKARFKAHYRAFKNHTYEGYQRGVDYYLQHTDQHSFPLPSDIAEAIRDSYEPPTVRAPRETPEQRAAREEAMTAWCKDEFAKLIGEKSVESVESDESSNA